MSRPTLPALDVRWLTDTTTTGERVTVPGSGDLQRVDYPIPPEIGHGWCDRLPLAHGISLFQGVHRFRPEVTGQRVPLGEFRFTFPEPTLVIQTIQGGTICHQESYPHAEFIYQPGHDFFRRADALQVIPLIEASADSAMTALILAEDVLAQLIGEELAATLIARLGLETRPVVKVRPIPIRVSAPLRAALSLQLQGTLQRLFAQSKVLEYLCLLSAQVITPDLAPPRLQCRQDRIRELHDYLTHLEGRLPSLDDLAVQFRMPARRLNTAFAEQYGLPIYAFIADWRLNEAYVAIRDSEVALKVLADRLGYSHVNHFSRSFKRKFGYPPGSLRRGRRVANDETGSEPDEV
ncbi:helix-turn-helix transcriptional regulator [Thiocapsa roseopersicina]|uniref:AraC-type DNA-binding protein n=1 Tax=Thiocapsa roseopersicina TaxID=1058 RepID=A0A1H2QH66_THIRO|nr:AraC family transcriptional regulator [Thiocapsa roseopersicina]SDW06511.1 AraC-type DNA-binding protein [Thiocapsa roseopersicina]